MRRFFKILLIAIPIAMLLLFAMVVHVGLNMWTVKGLVTCLSRKIDFDPDAYEKTKNALGKNLLTSGFEDLTDGEKENWEKSGWNKRISFFFHAGPAESMTDRMEGKWEVTNYLCNSYDDDEEWLKIAEETEKIISEKMKIKSSKIRLNPEVYGDCKSEEFPNDKVACYMQIGNPIDVKKIKEDLKSRRIDK